MLNVALSKFFYVHLATDQAVAIISRIGNVKARPIKVDWIKIGQKMVCKPERGDAPPAQSGSEQAQSYADNSF